RRDGGVFIRLSGPCDDDRFAGQRDSIDVLEIEGVDSGRVRSARWEGVTQGERLGARRGAAVQARVRFRRMETALRPVLGAGDEIVLRHGPRSSRDVLRTNLARAVQSLEAIVVVGLVLGDDSVAEDVDDLPMAVL